MPYWRLSSIYFFYFSVVGGMSPYWGLYLQNLEFKPHQIGALIAVPMLTKLIAPNLWSLLSDRIGRRMLVIRLGSLGACLAFIGVFFLRDYFALMAVVALYSIFWNAVLPQFESMTLSFLGDKVHHYSRVRLWGSIGFIVSVILLGWWFDLWGVEWLPTFLFIFLLGIFVFACTLPAIPSEKHESHWQDFLADLKQNRSYVFFIVLFFLQFSHGAYYGFYSIYMESFGYSKTVIGLLWALGVLSEIIIFIYVPQIFRAASAYSLLSFTLLMSVLRWLLTAYFPENVALVLFAQCIHALSFGMAHALAIRFIKQTFQDSAQGQAQALYSAFSFGGGAAIGAYVSGLLWAGSPTLTFFLSAILAFVAWLMCKLTISKDFLN